MITVTVWDKASPVNEFTAEEFLRLSPWIKEEMDILLAGDETRINRVDNAVVIRGILQLPDASLEELAAAWQERLNEPVPEPEADPSAEERDGTAVIGREAMLPVCQKVGMSREGKHPAGKCYAFRESTYHFVMKEANSRSPADDPQGGEAM